MDEVVDNKGVLVIGNYGTGKSHLMSVIAAVANDASNLEYLQNRKFAEAMKPIAGKFEILRIEIGGVTMSLREILFGFIQEDFDARGIDYDVPDFSSVRDNKKLIKDMMMAFNEKYPDKGYLIVVDEFLSYLTSRSNREIVLDLDKNTEVASLTAKAELWRGSTVDTTNVTYKWAIMDSSVTSTTSSGYDAAFGTGWRKLSDTTGMYTGTATATITVFAAAVDSYAVFKCVATDSDSTSSTYNSTFTDVATFIDNSDPIQVVITSTGGDVFKNGQAPMYYAEGTHPAIIDKEMFEMVRVEMQRRKDEKVTAVGSSRFTSKYPFSGLLVCGECGHKLRRHVRTVGTGMKVPAWGCSNRISNGRAACDSHHVNEDTLQHTYTAAIRDMIEDAEGNEIGVVCSGTVSPWTGKSIGTGYVKSGFHKLDTEIFIRVRNKALKAKIVKTPFF